MVWAKTNNLLAHFDKVRLYSDQVAGDQFFAILNGLLNRRHAAVFPPQIGGGQPELVEEIPRRFIEFSDIPHDIHVADMVALPRIHGSQISDEFVHGCFPRLERLSAAVPRSRLVAPGARSADRPDNLPRGTIDTQSVTSSAVETSFRRRR
jgi:hypothetical protein